MPKPTEPKPPTDWKRAFKKLSDEIEGDWDCLRCPAFDICRDDKNSDENRCRRCLGKWARRNF